MILRGLFLFFMTMHVFATDTMQLQRGKVFFTQYCAGCHALRYTTGYLQKNSLPVDDARQWFGRMPPDLSLIARERGSQWLYNYLTGFYADNTRPFGSNNHVVPDVGMPNVLAPLHEAALKQDVQDVIVFLVYVAEPVRMVRYRIGCLVMIFLAAFGLIIYRLKVLRWRDLDLKI